jgi:urea transport system permease protein
MADAMREAGAAVDIVLGGRDAKLAAVRTLGDISTSRSANLLRKTVDAARLAKDDELLKAAEPALAEVESYQKRITLVKHTFDGLSSGSILVLLALGLSIVFGLMGVINMAHGEFMMLGAFATYVVAELFKRAAPGWFDYYPIVAIPAAFLVAATVGLLCETLVVRHLYGRPLETLLATWGIGLIIIQSVRMLFGDTLSVTPPRWMVGSVEVMPDLNLGLNRIFIICYGAICIALVYFLVNRTKLGLLLRATTQNREMAAALGVGTRRVDAVTFAFGAGLAGLAGVAVPMYDKINPGMGGDYVVESFMVVVVGGVGKLAGVVWAGLGLGFIRKYLEPALQYIPPFGSSASVISRVIVLGLIVTFLQWRPSGIFPPKGRLADAA